VVPNSAEVLVLLTGTFFSLHFIVEDTDGANSTLAFHSLTR